MRKTLFALAVVTSVVLLQAPAWAPTTTTRRPPKPNPNLYVAQVNPMNRSAGRTVEITSPDCVDKVLSVTFKWNETKAMKTSASGKYQAGLTKVPSGHTQLVTINDVKKEATTCGGQPLPFTGAASTRLLALGLSLLVIGALLVLWGRRRPLIWR